MSPTDSAALWKHNVEPQLSMGILDPPLNDNQTISNASLTLTSKA